jgi:hypothetical protein
MYCRPIIILLLYRILKLFRLLRNANTFLEDRMLASLALLEATIHNDGFKAYTENAAAHPSHRSDEIPNTQYRVKHNVLRRIKFVYIKFNNTGNVRRT